MLSRSQPNFGMGLDIKIVQCLPGESCVPANSKIFGNALGMCHKPTAFPNAPRRPIEKHTPRFPNQVSYPKRQPPKPISMEWGYGGYDGGIF